MSSRPELVLDGRPFPIHDHEEAAVITDGSNLSYLTNRIRPSRTLPSLSTSNSLDSQTQVEQSPSLTGKRRKNLPPVAVSDCKISVLSDAEEANDHDSRSHDPYIYDF
jgi:hypothetical protein